MARYLLSLIVLFVFQTSSYSQDSIATAQVHKTIEKLHANKEIFPVVIQGDTIFNIYEKAAAKSKTAQVKRCEGRLKEILSHDFYHKEDLAISDSANYIVVTYEGNTVLEFSDITAKKLNRGKAIIADKYVEKLGEYFDRIQPIVLKEKAEKIVKYLALYFFFLFVIIFVYRYNKKWILKNHHFIHKVLRLIRIYRLEEEERENATNNLLKIVKWLYGFGIALYTYLALPWILNIFYATRERGERMIAYVVNPLFDFVNTFIDYFPTLIKLIVIIFIFRTFLKLVNYFFKELEAGNVNINGFYKEWATPTSKLVKLFLYAFLLTIIFPLLPGSGSDVFKGVSMFLGLILSLGSTSVISNALSGLIMTYMRPFKIGDRIEADNVIGIVVQRNLLMTRVRTPKNVIITIPNAKILTGHSKNFTTAAERSNLIIHSTITIGYDVDWRIVHELLIAATKKTNGLITQSGKEAFVLQTGLDDYYVAYEVNAYTAQADKYVSIQSELHSNILDEFNKAGVEIMSPHYRANRSGEEITVHEVPAEASDEKEVEKKEEEMDINEKITMKMEQIEKEKEEEKAKEKEKEEAKTEKKDVPQGKSKKGEVSKKQSNKDKTDENKKN